MTIKNKTRITFNQEFVRADPDNAKREKVFKFMCLLFDK